MCNKCQELIVKQRYQVLLLKNQGYNISEIARIARISRDTLYRWLRNKDTFGLPGLANTARVPKHHPKEYSPYVKFLIKDIREKYKGIGPDKIQIKLGKYFGIDISTSGIAKELKRANLIKKIKTKRKNNLCQYLEKHKKRYLPGDKIEVDVKFVFKTRKSRLFQFSSIDKDTAIVNGSLVDCSDNYQAIRFLKQISFFYPFKIKIIQTDNASYFTNYYTGYKKSIDPDNPKIHPFDKACFKLKVDHYLIDKGKPQQNGKVERFHRTVDDEFYTRYSFKDKDDLIQRFKEYLRYYNNEREHLALDGLTPLEKLRTYKQYMHISYLPTVR